jgi:hypothetical protein
MCLSLLLGHNPACGFISRIRILMKRLACTPSHGQTLMLSKRRQFDMRLRHCGPPHTP